MPQNLREQSVQEQSLAIDIGYIRIYSVFSIADSLSAALLLASKRGRNISSLSQAWQFTRSGESFKLHAISHLHIRSALYYACRIYCMESWHRMFPPIPSNQLVRNKYEAQCIPDITSRVNLSSLSHMGNCIEVVCMRKFWTFLNFYRHFPHFSTIPNLDSLKIPNAFRVTQRRASPSLPQLTIHKAPCQILSQNVPDLAHSSAVEKQYGFLVLTLSMVYRSHHVTLWMKCYWISKWHWSDGYFEETCLAGLAATYVTGEFLFLTWPAWQPHCSQMAILGNSHKKHFRKPSPQAAATLGTLALIKDTACSSHIPGA